MKTYNWYRFTFEDGHRMECKGMSKNEMLAEIRKHGKLISKTLIGRF